MCTQIGCYRVNPHLKHPRDKQNKRTNGPCTAAYLAIYSFRQVIRADPTPVFGRKIHVSQGFANVFLNLLGCGQELHFAELGCNGRRLFLSCFFALLRMCFLSSGFPHFRRRNSPSHRGKIPTFSGPCQEAGSTTASCRMRACSIR